MKLIIRVIARYSLIILLAIVSACEVPQGQGNGTPGLSQETVGNFVEGLQDVSTEFKELAKPNKVQAWVDNLIVKAQPGGKDMPQVAVMQEGETADYLYQRTVRKSEFLLRGQRFMEPWILIRTQDGTMGWVHEGGVRFIGTDLNNLLSIGQNTDPNARTRSLDQPENTNPSQDRQVIPGQRVGAIRLKSTETELMGIYGPTNVSRGVVDVPGGQQEACTILLGGTQDELRITWKDDSHSQVKAVYIIQPNARWFTRQGLTVGISLAELTKVNKAPVNFYGFNWTYSGTVNSWKNGSLNPYEKYFYVVLSPQASPSLINKYEGNQVFSSNDEGIELLNIYVSRVVVYLD
ncbi:MAG: hypothetical protein SF052_17440 [Bacteroidia bacterium]|nr:hypothetical protein [Bacteroidia bacterium]